VRIPAHQNEYELRHRLLDDFGVHVRLVGANTWRVGLLGAQATHDAALRVLTAVENALGPGQAMRAAITASGSVGGTRHGE
jgi:hypothetical protein